MIPEGPYNYELHIKSKSGLAAWTPGWLLDRDHYFPSSLALFFLSEGTRKLKLVGRKGNKKRLLFYHCRFPCGFYAFLEAIVPV